MKIGILGGGQLGRMLALAGARLGMECRCFDPAPDACAGQVAPLVAGEYEDRAALARFARGLDLATYEFENVPAEAARALARRLPLYPPPGALEVAQDRLAEKDFFLACGIPVAPFVVVDSMSDLRRAAELLGGPAILKTRRSGYDGKGQCLIRSARDLARAWRAVGAKPSILESVIPFDREVSCIGVRDRRGEILCYPLIENRHSGGILRLSLAPAPGLNPAMAREAREHMRRLMEALDYTGVLTIEFFEVNGRLLANEMACRVHNSGHWTIEGAETSQFENHLRAVAGLPLGSTQPRTHAAMANLIGRAPALAKLLAIPGAAVHLYGKAPRAGRKIGHLTLLGDDPEELEARAHHAIRAAGQSA